jgi:GNAT superfamily N-acetyltransferase
MEATTRARIEEFWARRLGASRATAGGLQLIPHPDGFFMLAREASVLVLAPPALHGRLGALGRARLLDRAALVEVLPAGARCIGPAFVGYLDVAPDLPGSALASFASANDSAFDDLRASATSEEWEHAGLDHAAEPLYAVVEQGRVLCAAGAQTLLESVAHIGVIAHPTRRGRGLARQVVAALTRDRLAIGLVPQYQTLMSNTASLAVGKALGFEHFATTFGARWQ